MLLGGDMWQLRRAHRLVAVAAAMTLVAGWFVGATQPPSLLTVIVLDVGQGDSILVRSPAGRDVLIDAGGEVGAERSGWDIGRMRVVPALRRAGVRRLDVAVLSHPHEDHVGGLPAVIENIAVGLVLEPGVPHPSPSYARFLKAVEARRIPYRIARAGASVDLGAGVLLTVIYPPEPIPPIGGDKVHAAMMVTRLDYRRASALFTGDLEAPAERVLLDFAAPLAAQVLKVGHHGSRTSTSPEFVARVHPQIGIISVGADNAFGHPHETTLRTLQAAGVAIYRTDLDGAITVTSDGVGWQVATMRERVGARVH
jgi:competence protein ComEC